MVFPATKLPGRVQSGLKKKSIKGGKELVLKMGFGHHCVLLTLPSVTLPFYGKSEEASRLPVIVLWSVLNGRPGVF